jgi:putative intracellular protease/amidase
MFDLAINENSHKLVREFSAAGKLTAAVCHGPAAFVFVKNGDGTPFLEGAKVSGFTDNEEKQIDMLKYMPFSLEQELTKVAAEFKQAPVWQPCVVVDRDGNLITRQNPASAQEVAEAMLKTLKG